MLTMNPVIVFIMLFVPSLCEDPPEPVRKAQEEFLKEVNEFGAKEHKIPNMYKRWKRNACMDGFLYVNGECILPTTKPTTTTPEAQTTPKTTLKTTPIKAEAVPATPKNPAASDEKEKEGRRRRERGSIGVISYY